MSNGGQHESPARRSPFPRGCLAALLVAFAGCGGCLLWSSQRGWTVGKLERLIAAEVPPDCDRRAAEAWFDRHGIPHRYAEGAVGSMRGPHTVAQLAGLRDDEVGGTLWGEIDGPEANVDLFWPGRITVYFFFDKRGRRAGHLVDPFVLAL